MISMNDTFGSVLERAKTRMGSELAKATGQNAYALQAEIHKGVAGQRFKSNSLEDWKDLSWDYKQRKEGDLILIESKDLVNSIEVARLGTFEYEVGTNDKRARAHEFGYEPRNLPARPYMRPGLEAAAPRMLKNWEKAVQETLK